MMNQGKETGAIQWGAWASAGMAASSPTLLARLVRQGYGAVPPATGLAMITAVLQSTRPPLDEAALMASPFDWATLLKGAHVCGSMAFKTSDIFQSKYFIHTDSVLI